MSDSISGKKQPVSDTEASCQSRKKISFAEVTLRKKSSRASSVYKSSDEYFEYCCDPCSTEGEHVEAHGFCTECKEYLCSTCFKSHSRSKLSRHHALLDKDNMKSKDFKTCDPCKSAGDEADAARYCMDCKEYLCENCSRSHARSKLSKHHVLLDKPNMPIEPERIPYSSIAGLNICKSADIEEYRYIRDINVSAVGNERDCFIVDMALVSDTSLVLVDTDNESLKLVDVRKSAVVNVLGLNSEPYGITTVSKDQVAVALPNQYQIQFVSVNGCLSVLRSLKTTGLCINVLCMKDKLYVSYENPVKFEIFQLTGAICKTIVPDPEVLKNCNNPRYMAISQDESLIYVSDWRNNKLMCLNMDGHLESIYSGQLDKPYDVTISPFDSVYLCNKRQHVVYKMPLDLSEATVVLGKGDGLVFPIAMCFDPGKQHLFVSNGSADCKFCNFIQVYELK